MKRYVLGGFPFVIKSLYTIRVGLNFNRKNLMTFVTRKQYREEHKKYLRRKSQKKFFRVATMTPIVASVGVGSAFGASQLAVATPIPAEQKSIYSINHVLREDHTEPIGINHPFTMSKETWDKLKLPEKPAPVQQNTQPAPRPVSRINSIPTGSPSVPLTDTSAYSGGVVESALKFIGVPYVWGGSTPRGFDCSGLTQYVFAMHGKRLPRTASAQLMGGTRVSWDDVQPGDLIASHSHVGIYIGGGKMIHAPRPGRSVEITTIQWMASNGGVPVRY